MYTSHLPHPAISCSGFEQLQKGEAKAFNQFYRLFRLELEKNAAAMLGGKITASDAVKHCFIKCWLRSRSFDSFFFLQGILYGMIRNNFLDLNGSNDASGFDYLRSILQTVSPASIRGGLSRAALHLKMSNYPDALFLKVKPVFAKYYLRRLAPGEIATELNMSVQETGKVLQLAFQVLHLIFSEEPF